MIKLIEGKKYLINLINIHISVNKFPHARFTTKIGIHSCLENLYWFTNYSMHSFFPRCYQVIQCKLLDAFTLPTLLSGYTIQTTRCIHSSHAVIRLYNTNYSMHSFFPRCYQVIKYKLPDASHSSLTVIRL